MDNSPYTFYIVATPIGNLEDISFRALSILKQVDVVLCEDTRVTKKLFDHYEITTKRESYHAHSSDHQESSIVQRVKEGMCFALVSDAGTPTISDPGVKLVSILRETFGNDLSLISIPGASAVITALSSSGFAGNDFRFFGFIPHKKGRTQFFESIAEHPTIAVCYESPHRLLKTLTSLSALPQFATRQLCIARELTKMFEEKQYGTAGELLAYFEKHPERVRGEFVIVVDKQ